MSAVIDPVIAASAPHANVTVMASAGTGKTWLLITRLIRLLLDGAEPGAILAVTFTRKAAGEMQARLTEQLAALARLDEANLGARLDAMGVEADDASRGAARGLFERILRAPHPVRTTTFHAFCQEILRRFPLDADVPPGFEVTEDGGLIEQEALDALFTEATADPRDTLAQALDDLSRCCRSPSVVTAALREFLRHRGDWWAYTQGADDAPAVAAERLAAQLEIDLGRPPDAVFFTPELESSVQEFGELLQRHVNASNLKHAQRLEAALDPGRALDERIAAVSEVFLTAEGEPRKRKASAAQERSLGAAGQQRLLDLHAAVSETLLQLRNRRRRYATFTASQAWYRAGSRLLELYQEIKRDRRLLDFNDLEWKTYALLNCSDNAHWVQYKLDQRIDHLLIDEFQDTNPTQWRLLLPLLEELAAGTERRRSVFLVGDVKQSIYRFRRADPALLETAREWLATRLRGTEFPLNASWRSAPCIMEFINRVFGAGELHDHLAGFEPHSSRHPKLWGHIELLPLSKLATEPPAVHAPGELRNPLLRPRPEDRDRRHYQEGQQIAARIARLVDSGVVANGAHTPRPIGFGDILILTRNRTHVHEYESALRDAGIPYLGGGRSSLLDCLEIQDMTALLEVLTTPYSNLALATVLRSPLFGCSDADLMALAERARKAGAAGGERAWFHQLVALAPALAPEAPLRRAFDRLESWKACADRMPVHDLLDRIYCDGSVPGCYLAAFPRHLHARVQSNLMRFIELALEVESGRYPSIPRFLANLQELHRHARENIGEPPLQQGPAGAVRIMTIHAAKGLEAPVVFLADAARGQSAARAFQALVEWPPTAGSPRHFLLVGKESAADDKSSALLAGMAAEEQREEANLLYVALTRARQHLYLSGCAPKQGDNLGWYGSIAMHLAGDPQRIADEGLVVAADAVPPGNPRAAGVAATETSAPDERLSKPLPAAAPAGEIVPSRVGRNAAADLAQGGAERPATSTAHPRHDREEDQRRGSVIHRMLDILTTTSAARPALDALACEFAMGADDPSLEAWWREALAVVNKDDLRDYFDPQRYLRAYNEIPLSYEHDGRIVHGVIDRLVVHRSGVTLIDYKTRRDVDPARLEQFAAPYQEQLRLYRAGVRRLWPERSLRVVLLFTEGAHAYELADVPPGD